MKHIVFTLALVLIGLVSCERYEPEAEGNIPGMGDTPGKLEIISEFEVPDGIHILGNIVGTQDQNTSGSFKSTNNSKADFSCYGSGQQVRLKVTFLNSSTYGRTIFLPKGLVWECLLGNAQHGLQVQTTWISLNPNETKTVVIDLYCVNLGLPGPGVNDTYRILGVTSSRILWYFLDYIGWRKVNYEMIVGNDGAKTDGPSYDEITARFQVMVHNLTDRGIELTQDDIDFIRSIPKLPEEQRPELDENSQYPEYFKEFVVECK